MPGPQTTPRSLLSKPEGTCHPPPPLPLLTQASNKTFTMHFSDLEDARTSFGTDEDMICIFVPARRVEPPGLANGGAGTNVKDTGVASDGDGSTSQRLARGLQDDLFQMWGSFCALGAGLIASGENGGGGRGRQEASKDGDKKEPDVKGAQAAEVGAG